MELLEAITKKFEAVRENLAPIQQQLAESQQSAPTEEMKQTASKLSSQLAAAIDESSAAIRESVQILDAEIAAMNQVAEQAKQAVAEMSKKREAAIAGRKTRRKPKSTTPAPFVADAELYDRLRKELLIYVDLEKPALAAKSADQGLAFNDWANESVLAGGRLPHADSSVVARSSDDTTAEPADESAPRAPEVSTRQPVSSFDSWLQESTRLPRSAPAAADARQTNWFKLFSANDAPPANEASQR